MQSARCANGEEAIDIPISKGNWLDVDISLSGEAGYTSMIALNRHTTPVGDGVKAENFEQADFNLAPPNIHGQQPFIVKLQVPLLGDAGIMVYDRQRSFTSFILNERNLDVYPKLEAEIRKSPFMGQKMYRWAKRVGDWELSVCLDVEPKGPFQW